MRGRSGRSATCPPSPWLHAHSGSCAGCCMAMASGKQSRLTVDRVFIWLYTLTHCSLTQIPDMDVCSTITDTSQLDGCTTVTRALKTHAWASWRCAGLPGQGSGPPCDMPHLVAKCNAARPGPRRRQIRGDRHSAWSATAPRGGRRRCCWRCGLLCAGGNVTVRNRSLPGTTRRRWASQYRL